MSGPGHLVPRPSRRAVLRGGLLAALAGTPLLGGCSAAAPAAAPGTVRPHRHAYGPHPQQFGDLYLPAGEPRGTVVVIHGGFWLSTYGLDLGAATSADLAGRGWAAWNIEYRRVGDGGGWPTTFTDVAAALDHLDRLAGVDTDRVVPLGHSAGGQLAVWATGRDKSPRVGPAPRVRPRAAVAQAGVLDLAGAADEHLGGDAAPALLGGTPAAVPDRYAAVDPAARVPPAVPVRCVHGTDDTTVPLSQSQVYVDRARRAGADAALVEVPGDHFTLIDPSTVAWARTVAVLDELTPA